MATVGDRLRAIGLTELVMASSYAVLVAVLLATRLVGLNRSYASDELMTVRGFVIAGPREILAGPYIPNNHELFSLVGWATTELVGLSAIGLRLWSVVPFVVGVLLVTTWLHVRLGAAAGLLFLFFATASPLLLDITRQARGYGLAFAAMAALTVAALEAQRTGRTALVAVFCAAGVVGTWTLPHFGVAFLATGLVLLANRALRRTVALGLAASCALTLVWYAPHLDDIAEGSRQAYAAPIEGWWVVTAPIDQTLIPALRWVDETLLDPDLASLVVVVALALVLRSSPLLVTRASAGILCSGVIATVMTFWLVGASVAPRFLSFLLVPLFMLLASGSAAILTRATTGRQIGRAVLVLSVLAVAGATSVPQMWEILRLPREASREAAEFVRTFGEPTPVFAYVPYPRDVEFYLGREVERPKTPEQALGVCALDDEAILLTQPWLLEEATFPCTMRPGTEHAQFEQYARGGRIDVWIIPASS